MKEVTKPLARVDLEALAEELRSHSEVSKASMVNESQRGIAVVSAASLEQCLTNLLNANFKANGRRSKKTEPLFDGFGPLSTFSGKISLSYCFSLINEDVEHDLQLIRKIRNHFAHSLKIKSFAAMQISGLVDSLRLYQREEPQSHPPSDDKNANVHLKTDRFLRVVGYISGTLDATTIIVASDIPLERKFAILSKLGSTT